MKKITKLLMLVTVAGIGFLASCKDYNNDMFQEMKISDANLSSSLDAKYAELKGLINSLQTAQQACKDLCKTRQDSAAAALTNHVGRISALEALNIATRLGNLEAADPILNARIDSLNAALALAPGQTIPTAIANLENATNAAATDLAFINGLLGANGANFTALQNAINSLPTTYATQKALNDSARDLRQYVDNELIVLNTRYNKLQNTVDSFMVAHNDTIDNIQTAIAGLIESYENVSDSVATLYNTVAGLSAKIDSVDEKYDSITDAIAKDLKNLRQRFNNLKNKVDKIDDRLKEVESQIEDILARLDDIEEARATQITSIVNQGVYNPMFGYVNTPIGTSNILFALYGNTTYSGMQFPVDEAPNELFDKLTAEDIAMLQRTSFAPFTIPAYIKSGSGDKVYAGDIYFTVNPADADISGAEFTLVDSQDNEGAFKIGEISPLDTQFKLGFATDAFSRASVAEASANGLYKAEVTIDAADVDANMIDIEGFEKAVKNSLGTVFTKIKNHQNVGLSDLETINFKDILLAVNSYFNGKMVAQAVKGEWDDAYGTHSVYSKYEYGAAALHPFSYNLLKDANVKLPSINPLQGVDFSQFNITYNEIKFDDPSKRPYFMDGDTKIFINVDDLVAKINASLGGTIDNVKESIVNEFGNKFSSYINLANSYINKINSATGKIADKLGHINNLMQPALYILDSKGEFHHLSTEFGAPTIVSYSGDGYLLVASSYTGNLIATSAKTFVGCTNAYFYQASTGNWRSAQSTATYAKYADFVNEGEDFNTVLEGGNKAIKMVVDDKKDLVYEVALSCLDYSGRTSTRKYYIKVVD